MKEKTGQKLILKKGTLFNFERTTSTNPKSNDRPTKQNQENFSSCDDLNGTIKRLRKQLKVLTKMKKRAILLKVCPAPVPPTKK